MRFLQNYDVCVKLQFCFRILDFYQNYNFFD